MQRRGPQGPSILIVDDFEPNLLALEAVLSPLGGGTIWVESSFGVGTTFYFTLPLR